MGKGELLTVGASLQGDLDGQRNISSHTAYFCWMHRPVPGEIFWAELVEILVFPSPTRYMLTSSGFPLLN